MMILVYPLSFSLLIVLDYDERYHHSEGPASHPWPVQPNTAHGLPLTGMFLTSPFLALHTLLLFHTVCCHSSVYEGGDVDIATGRGTEVGREVSTKE